MLTVGLAAAVDEAVAALAGLEGLAISSCGSGCLHIYCSTSITMASSRGTLMYRAEPFDVLLHLLFNRGSDLRRPTGSGARRCVRDQAWPQADQARPLRQHRRGVRQAFPQLAGRR